MKRVLHCQWNCFINFLPCPSSNNLKLNDKVDSALSLKLKATNETPKGEKTVKIPETKGRRCTLFGM